MSRIYAKIKEIEYLPRKGRKSTVTNSPHTLLKACNGHTNVNFFLEKL
jgi:hypothetical protein